MRVEFFFRIDDDNIRHRGSRGIEDTDTTEQIGRALDTPLDAIGKGLGELDLVWGVAWVARVGRMNGGAGWVDSMDGSDSGVGLVRTFQYLACISHHGYGQAEIHERLEGVRCGLRDYRKALANQLGMRSKFHISLRIGPHMKKDHPSRKLAVILHADVVGSTHSCPT